MSGYKHDLICPRCAHADLLDRVAAAFRAAKPGDDIRTILAPLMAEAQRLGFGTPVGEEDQA